VRNIEGIESESIDLIFSNELLCDLDQYGLEKTLMEFYRILNPNSQMAHAEINPVPENTPQRLFIEADKYSLETSQPKPDWFSPYSDEIAILMHKIGFKDITIKYLKIGIQLDYESAIETFTNWSVDPEFLKKHDSHLRSHGIEYPLEHIIFCNK